MTLRVNLWSGPRNISTALMYAFAQRSDTQVVDEPLYAHFLRVSGARHPGREEVLAAQDPDGRSVIRDVILGPATKPVLFCKQMAHHLVDLDWGFLEHLSNVLLIRDPADVLRTITRQVPEPRLADIGIGKQAAVYELMTGLGQQPPVLDAALVLADPRGSLEELCHRLGLAFEEAMLSWPAGGLPEDGVWAPHWYDVIHRTTGFRRYEPKTEPVPDDLVSVLEEARPLYEKLRQVAIGA